MWYKAFIPYSLALLGVGISSSYMQILKSLTNKIILAYDADEAGIEGTRRDTYRLKKEGFEVSFISQYPGMKDMGEIEESLQQGREFEHATSINYYRSLIENVISRRCL